MAISPLFVASTTILKQRLRLSGVKESGEYLIEDALEWSRATFYRRLGVSRVATLVSYSYAENPTSENGILRTIANQVEIKIVRQQLLRTMTTLQRDGGAQAMELWNAEGIFRGKSPDEIQAEIKRLDTEIEDAFDLLTGEDETVGDETSIRVATI